MAVFPSIDLTDFDVTRLDPRQYREAAAAVPGATKLAELARHGAYVGVGLAVLGLQRIAVQRRQASRHLERVTHR